MAENLKLVTVPVSANIIVAGANNARSTVRIINKDGSNSVLITDGVARMASTVSQISLLTFSAVPSSGTWKLDFEDYGTTAALAHNISAANLQTAVRLLAGLGAVTVTGNFTSGFTITLVSVGYPPPVISVVESSLVIARVNTTATIAVSSLPVNGSYKVKVVKSVNGLLSESVGGPYDGISTTLQTELRLLMNDPALTYNTGSGLITFVKDAGLIQRVEIIEAKKYIPVEKTITFSITATAGSFKLSYLGVNSGTIAFNANAATVQTTLRAVAGLSNVVVTFLGAALSDGFTVDFNGVENFVDLGQADNTLTGAASAPVTISIAESQAFTRRALVSVASPITAAGSQETAVTAVNTISTPAQSSTYGQTVAAGASFTLNTTKNVYGYSANAINLEVYEGF